MALRRSTGLRDKLNGIDTNVLTNGLFATNTAGWTAAAGTLAALVGPSPDGSYLQITSSGAALAQAYQDFPTVIGGLYRVGLQFEAGTAPNAQVLVGSDASPSSILISPNYSDVAWNKKDLFFIATATITRLTLQSNATGAAQTALFDGVIVEEILNGFRRVMINCFINVYTGNQPATADLAASGNLLYTLTKNGDGITGLTWLPSSGGVINLDVSVPVNGTAGLGGTAGYARCYENTDNPALASSLNARFDMAIATSGAEINMTNTTIQQGAVQSCTGFSYTLPPG